MPRITNGPTSSSHQRAGGTLQRDATAFTCPNPLPVQLLQKFIAYAKAHCQPQLSTEAKLALKEFYLQLRQLSIGSAGVPVTVRFTALVVALDYVRNIMIDRVVTSCSCGGRHWQCGRVRDGAQPRIIVPTPSAS